MVENNNNRLKSIMSAIFAATLWSTGGIFIKLVYWNPVGIAGCRSLIAALVLMVYGGKPKLNKSKPQIFGVAAYASTVFCFVIANKLTTSANVILLQYTAPIFVAILGVWILKEKIYIYDIISIIVVILGMLLFFVDSVDSGNFIGNILAIFTGVSLAGVTISLRMQKDGSGMDTVTLGNLLAFLVSIPFIMGGLPDMKSLVVLTIMGVFQLGIPYIFYINSTKYLSALEAILLTVAEPLLNPVWVFIFVGERPGIYAILGGIIVISSVTMRSLYIGKKPKEINLQE